MLQSTGKSHSTSPYHAKVRRKRKTSKEERVCPVCAHAFKKAEHLARHLRSHTKEKPFNCPICDKVFTRQDTLLRHSRSHSISNSEGRDGSPLHCESAHGHVAQIPSDELLVACCPSNMAVPPQVGPQRMTESMMATVSPPGSFSIGEGTPTLAIPDDGMSHDQITPLTSLPSLEAEDFWHKTLQPTMWDDRFDQEWGSILTGDDFDLDAVNMSLLHTSDSVPVPEMPVETNIPQTQPSSNGGLLHPSSLQQQWHTFFKPIPLSRQMNSDPSQDSNKIDESYRKRLAEHLQQPVQHGILPSTPFLDLCIQAYFAKFHPLFPIVHKPTFRPGKQNSTLLLSVCSAGSLFIGSTRALAHGVSMFERLNKAHLASWDTYLSRSEFESTTAMQAVLIGQTFGLLMGRPKDLFGIDIFHGAIIAWARNAKLFHSKHSDINLLSLDDKALQDVWMAWIMIEVKLRITLALHIHDAELARIHHHEPLLRHSLDRLPKISSNELFAAPTAHHWKVHMLNLQPPQAPSTSPHDFPAHPQPPTPDFATTGMLETISALSSETNTECHLLLKTWYTQHALPANPTPSRLNNLILWHSIYITLHSDLNALEISLGRDGPSHAQESIPDTRLWVASPGGKRCLLHAMHIQRHFEALPTGSECAFHVPLCLYYCGLIWACSMSFSSETVIPREGDEFEELLLEGIDRGLEKIVPKMASASLLRIVGLLQRISYWKIAQSLAATLLGIVEMQNLF